MLKITFKTNYYTHWGEQIMVVGNIPELGNGIVEEGFPLIYQGEGNWSATLSTETKTFDYQYVVVYMQQYETNREWGEMRTFSFQDEDITAISLTNQWRAKYHPENALYNSAFLNVIFNTKPYKTRKVKKTKQPQVQFQINAPRIETNQRLCILGNIGALGNWGAGRPLLLGNENYPQWTGRISFIAGMNIEYKYGIYDTKEKVILFLEDGENRRLSYSSTKKQELTFVNDNYFHHPEGNWKGTGVALPVFALRSENGFGIGEFTDIKLLVNWAKKTGMKMVQILPINDTSATGTWVDSYPYAAISVFALHPMYLNVAALSGFEKVIDQEAYSNLQKRLNALDTVDYEAVNANKLNFALQIFNETKGDFFKRKDFKKFFAENENWLKPYAFFCYLRDKFGTADFNQWELDAQLSQKRMAFFSDKNHPDSDKIAFHYYLQFHLDAQLSEVANYARKNNILLKGDIPIGIYRYSVDAWTQPQLYHMNGQAGAPPDPFSDLGQNWGFPTYNWEVMAKDGFAWWQNRLKTLSRYFDAFRIDHILGFFRIWQVPYEQLHASLGYFYPAIPVTTEELESKGIHFDYDRFCKPYITSKDINEAFGDDSQYVRYSFLQRNSISSLTFKEAFNTQRKLENYFKNPENEQYLHLKDKLLDMHTNVLFIEDQETKGHFHPRFDFYKTPSYLAFPKYMQDRLYGVYLDYYYKRQEGFWASSALKKLPAIKSATNMLICGEDLGMIPDCVPQVMKDMDLLTLEIQRMSKNPTTEFLQAADTPYYSVCSPSSHDVSPIRLWWEEENRSYIQRFYNEELKLKGTAPTTCTTEIVEQIIQQHLDLPSMWAVFPICDLLGMDEQLKHPKPSAERINEPSNSQHYWRYRLHLTMEEVLKEKDFGQKLKNMIAESGR